MALVHAISVNSPGHYPSYGQLRKFSFWSSFSSSISQIHFDCEKEGEDEEDVIASSPGYVFP